MTKETTAFLSYNSPIENLPFRFEHKAMNTIYEILIHHDNNAYAEQAANEAFNEIDRLELELSRFNSNSDISRINALQQLETITLGNDCYQCLEQCSTLYQQTRGVFDISAGFIVDLWKKLPADRDRPDSEKIESALKYTGMPWLHLLDNFQVQLMSERISLDLGGFGKGYAIQVASDLLKDWHVNNGLINAGMSSMISLSESCSIEVRHPEKPEKILLNLDLNGKAISGSGIKKGQHIIDPRNGYPVIDKIATWAISKDPGVSDALSTSFMIMSFSEIEEFCDTHKVGALIITSKEKIIQFGEF